MGFYGTVADSGLRNEESGAPDFGPALTITTIRKISRMTITMKMIWTMTNNDDVNNHYS